MEHNEFNINQRKWAENEQKWAQVQPKRHTSKKIRASPRNQKNPKEIHEIKGNQQKSMEIIWNQRKSEEINRSPEESRKSKEAIGNVFCGSCRTNSGASNAIRVTRWPRPWLGLTADPWTMACGQPRQRGRVEWRLTLTLEGGGRQLLRKRQASYT